MLCYVMLNIVFVTRSSTEEVFNHAYYAIITIHKHMKTEIHKSILNACHLSLCL